MSTVLNEYMYVQFAEPLLQQHCKTQLQPALLSCAFRALVTYLGMYLYMCLYVPHYVPQYTYLGMYLYAPLCTSVRQIQGLHMADTRNLRSELLLVTQLQPALSSVDSYSQAVECAV